VQTAGRFADQDNIAERQEIKGAFEAGAQPPAPLGQGAHLAQLAGPQGGDPAGLAPVGGPQHEAPGLLGGHATAPSTLRVVAELDPGLALPQLDPRFPSRLLMTADVMSRRKTNPPAPLVRLRRGRVRHAARRRWRSRRRATEVILWA